MRGQRGSSGGETEGEGEWIPNPLRHFGNELEQAFDIIQSSQARPMVAWHLENSSLHRGWTIMLT